MIGSGVRNSISSFNSNDPKPLLNQAAKAMPEEKFAATQQVDL